jgi:8-oxo-dGTP pyrophosphatase MutT (NUDIX family)
VSLSPKSFLENDEMNRVRVDQMRKIMRHVRRDQREKRRRPVVAIVIEHAYSGLLLLIFGKDHEVGVLNPGLVKGGIEKGESILGALYREAREEVAIGAVHLDVHTYLGNGTVVSVKKKRGFERKGYFVFLATYFGELELRINPIEIEGYQWVREDEVLSVLATLRKKRPDKYALLKKVFRSAAQKRVRAQKQNALKRKRPR